MRKVAAHRVILTDGTILQMEVVTLDESGQVLEHHKLTHEEAGVEWYGGEYRIQLGEEMTSTAKLL